MVKSYDDNCYICATGDKANTLNVVELQDIRRLERLLVLRKILFKKVTVMSKGKSL